jgi:hypothetical protein
MYSISREIERVKELAIQMDHISKTMTMPLTGERLSYERASKLLDIALSQISDSVSMLKEVL